MNVAELIEELKKCEPTALVIIGLAHDDTTASPLAWVDSRRTFVPSENDLMVGEAFLLHEDGCGADDPPDSEPANDRRAVLLMPECIEIS